MNKKQIELLKDAISVEQKREEEKDIKIFEALEKFNKIHSDLFIVPLEMGNHFLTRKEIVKLSNISNNCLVYLIIYGKNFNNIIDWTKYKSDKILIPLCIYPYLPTKKNLSLLAKNIIRQNKEYRKFKVFYIRNKNDYEVAKSRL